MFKKENRLTKKEDIDKVFKKGKGKYGKYLGIKVLKNNLSTTRCGVLVGLKVSKKAVERNKIKRQIREILKTIVFEKKEGKDVLVLVLPEATKAKKEEINKELLNVLKIIT